MATTSKRQEAPGRLELVRAFVNTQDVEEETEELADAAALGRWLAARGLAERGARPSEADLGRALEVREALRALMLANGGHPPHPGAPAVLDGAAPRSRIELRFAPEGGSFLEPAARGVDGALGRILALVAAAQSDGTWARLKACPERRCRWGFYDHTRNRSGVWCTMTVCGNRAKARAYRERHART